MAMAIRAPQLSTAERQLIDQFQRDMPLEPRPYARIAESLGVEEVDVLDMLSRLKASGIVTRIGPVFEPNRVGVSTLAAMAVPDDRLTEVAGLVNQYTEVNHNYEREHDFNLWFVVTAPDSDHLQRTIHSIESRSGLHVLVLPMVKQYFIDLGFPIDWDHREHRT